MDNGGRAFPWCGDLNACPTIELGMSLRDYFAVTVDKDEYGDLLFQSITPETKDALAGSAKPTEPHNRADSADRIIYRVELIRWEMRWRAAVRYMMADAMLVERSK